MPYLIAFVGIMLLIVSHEFGHYLAGRLYNVSINWVDKDLSYIKKAVK